MFERTITYDHGYRGTRLSAFANWYPTVPLLSALPRPSANGFETQTRSVRTATSAARRARFFASPSLALLRPPKSLKTDRRTRPPLDFPADRNPADVTRNDNIIYYIIIAVVRARITSARSGLDSVPKADRNTNLRVPNTQHIIYLQPY